MSPGPRSHCALVIINTICGRVGKTESILSGPRGPPWQVQKPIQIVGFFFFICSSEKSSQIFLLINNLYTMLCLKFRAP